MRRRALKLTLCLITLLFFPNTHPFCSPFLSPLSACAEMGRWSVCQRKKVTSPHSPLPSVPARVRSNNKVPFQAVSLLLKSRALCLWLQLVSHDLMLRLIFKATEALIFLSVCARVCVCACTMQSQTVSRSGSVQRGKCITAAPSREEAWPVHRPAVI